MAAWLARLGPAARAVTVRATALVGSTHPARQSPYHGIQCAPTRHMATRNKLVSIEDAVALVHSEYLRHVV